MVKLNINNYFETIKSHLNLEKPYALSWGEWRKWHEKTKAERPIAYFIMDTIPDKWDDFIKFFTKPINDLRYGLRVRVFDRYHVINTGLKPGYADCDTRMLHGMFSMLVDFVEVEKAWMHVVWDPEERHNHKYPWWSYGWTRFKSFRNPQAGIDHLKWEMTLDSPKLLPHERSPSQAQTAREIWEIYHWWKFSRPARPDPHDASGWSDHCRQLEARGKHILDFESETDEERARGNECLDRSRELEAAYEAEDEEYLIRLVKIRKSLWT